MNLLGAILACALGAGLSLANGRLANRLLKRGGIKMALTASMMRQAVNIACLIAVYLLRGYLPFAPGFTLAGAALGLTVPSICLAFHGRSAAGKVPQQ